MSNPVNKIERQEFLNLFENVVEHTPKVAEELFKLRPFSSDEMFLKSLANVIAELSHEEKVAILRGHPDLAGRLASANLLTPESTREQREAGLSLLTEAELQRLRSHNAEYRQRFGFTFIICARENKAAAILEGLDRRLGNTREEEVNTGIGEVKKIARLRSIDILNNLSKCVAKL